MPKTPKVVLVHDHLTQDGGAEQVLRELMKLWPQAPVYTLVYDPSKFPVDFNRLLKGRVHTSGWQDFPGGPKHPKWLLTWIDGAYRYFDLSGFDIVISDASGWAKSVRTKPDTLHVCYCHTPTRYLWSSAGSYIEETGYPAAFKWMFRQMVGWFRRKDLRAALGVNDFVANSDYVAKRIKRYYGRKSTVIYPPVDISKFGTGRKKGDYYLVAGRLVPYKRIDVAIKAANQLKRPLKIMGDGVDRKRLEDLAGPTVEFTGRVSDRERKKLFAEARAVINPQEEDFGITMVEALASGTPVIAYGAGGAAEILEGGKDGVLFTPQTVPALADAIKSFERKAFVPRLLRKRAEAFSGWRFRQQLKEHVDKTYETFMADR